MTYEEALKFIQSFPDMERATFGARGPTMGLPAMKDLLKRLGDPHKGTKTIHVAGSKGKGSTSTFITSMLDEAGLNTALYTSPHLHDYVERLAFNMQAVSKEDFARGMEEIKPGIEAERDAGNNTISTFGILTALFFHLVKTSKKPVDWQVVEVGLGGRYDVTNVFESKEAAVITPISLEHVEILGSTQTEIAANKAGIVVPHCLTVLAQQRDQGARTAVGRRCHEVNAELVDVGKKFKVKPGVQEASGQTFTMEGPGLSLDLEISMLGTHQITNAATAVALIVSLRSKGLLEITDEQIKSGLKKAGLSGRLEILQKPSQSGPTIVADGAHNHESAEALAKSLQQFFKAKNCIFVIGVNQDKNISAIWKELSGLNKAAIATRSDNPRSMDPQEIIDMMSVFELERPELFSSQNVQQALDKALEMATAEDIICITGSLYVVAEARAILHKSAQETAQKFKN